MLSWRKMLDKKDVVRPWELGWILGARHYEPHVRCAPRGFEKQVVQCLLPILRVRAEVRERRAIFFIGSDPTMHVRIHTAVKGRSFLCPQLKLQRIQCSATRETQHHVEFAKTIRVNVRHRFRRAEPRKRDWSVQI